MKSIVQLVRPYKYSALKRLLEPRKFHAFCLGTNKSGTHSIANMFSKNYRAAHETDYARLIEAYLDYRESKILEEKFVEVLKKYNTYAWLDLDSSHVHVEYLEFLLELYPRAKYILTIRDCYSWADSCFNHWINHELLDSWGRLHEWRYGRKTYDFNPEKESSLTEKNLYPLEGYFEAWAKHNNKVLSLVPKERLLVIKTSEISRQVDRIADFLGVDSQAINNERSHSFQAPQKHNLFAKLDPEYVKSKAEKHCSDLMSQFFSDCDYLEKLRQSSAQSS